jgi:hypothetical protein
VVPQSEITDRSLREWGAGLADYLSRNTGRAVPPAMEESWLPPFDVSERALAALARVHFSETATTDMSLRRSAREAAGRILDALSAGEIDAGGPAAASWTWAALRALSVEKESGTPRRATFDRCAAAIEACAPRLGQITVPQRSLVVWALARRDVTSATRLRSTDAAVRSGFRDVSAGALVGLMPWLGWAELTYARFQPEPAAPSELPSAVALREMRSLVWKHQLRAEDLPPDQQDLAGGIVFASSKHGQVLPTWQVARPLAFIATMLGDERLTEEKEVPAELSRLLASLRFLRQLTAGEAEGHMYANPALAMGGVRASVFDQRMPPEATALTLMTVCETLQSLENIRARQEKAPEAGPGPLTPPQQPSRP